MEVLAGKKSRSLDRTELLEFVGGRPLWLDLGCGDGLFAYRFARGRPDWFVVGLDPAREPMRRTAWRAGRPVRKGGAPNLLLAVGGLPKPPPELQGLAARVTVLFPWASLLRGLLEASGPMLKGLAGLLHAGAQVEFLLNESIYEDSGLLERLGLPVLDESLVRQVLQPRLEAVGLRLLTVRSVPNRKLPFETSWGKRLADSHPQGASLHLLAERADHTFG